MSGSLDELKENIRTIIAEVSEIDDIPDDKSFKDLGIDSMTAIEIISEIERTYKVQIPETEVQGLTSFSKVVEYVQNRLATKQAAS